MIGNDWDDLLQKVYIRPGFINFMDKIKKEYSENICYPEYENLFNAFKLTPFNKVKIVILGQDPYHGEGEAHGLSFSVKKGVQFPPSLKNIFIELKNDLNINAPENGDLSKWANEGVLLLNSILSVRKDTPLSHKDFGWEDLTDYIIKLLNSKKEPIVFILWGSYARSKKTYITNKNHFIIESVHPSPLSANRGFFGSRPFSKANNFLKSKNIKEVDFTLQ